MKLELCGLTAVLAIAAGCASRSASPAATATTTSAPVSTTEVSAASVEGEVEGAPVPRVGKAQRSEREGGREDDGPPRRDDGRRGGFSGWK